MKISQTIFWKSCLFSEHPFWCTQSSYSSYTSCSYCGIQLYRINPSAAVCVWWAGKHKLPHHHPIRGAGLVISSSSSHKWIMTQSRRSDTSVDVHNRCLHRTGSVNLHVCCLRRGNWLTVPNVTKHYPIKGSIVRRTTVNFPQIDCKHRHWVLTCIILAVTWKVKMRLCHRSWSHQELSALRIIDRC